MRKLVCVMGSPRKDGHTGTLAAKMTDAAKANGAQVQTFELNNMTFKGCQGCMACKTGSEACVVKDELAPVLEAVRESDALVVTSPIYFGQISGQLKSFIDRTFSFLVPDFFTAGNPSRLAPGKKCAMVVSQADPDPDHFNVGPSYCDIFGFFGFQTELLRATGMLDDKAVINRPDLAQEAEKIGKWLVS